MPPTRGAPPRSARAAGPPSASRTWRPASIGVGRRNSRPAPLSRRPRLSYIFAMPAIRGDRMFLRHCLGLAMALVVSGAALAADAPRAVPLARDQITLSFAPLVKRAAPAVVNIYTKKVVQTRVSPFLD